MMKKFLSLSLGLVLSLSLVACGNKTDEVKEEAKPEVVEQTQEDSKEKVDLTLSVAVSVQDAMLELQEKYETENPNIKLNFNFGASGTLMQQIEQGADVDLFISAGKKQVDELEEKGLIINDSRIDLLKNDLVLIVNGKHKDEVKSVEDLKKLEGTAIAMGEPEVVPAGKYTKEALENLGVYEELTPKIVFTKDVREALNYVDSENTIAGFCYGSDAKASKNAVVAEILPEESHSPIVYPAAIISETKKLDEIQKFFDFIQTSESKAVFEKHGFK